MRSYVPKGARRLAALAIAVGAIALLTAPARAGEDPFVRIEKPTGDHDHAPADIVIRASGTGYEPAAYTGARARLMARRAAVVDGYRKLAAMRGKVVSSVTGRTYYESVGDFLKGASVVETRYYYDGRVEVDMELPVAAGEVGRSMSYDGLRQTLSRSGIAVVEVEPARRQITREEWEELFMKRQAGQAAPEESNTREQPQK